jgi:small subunit ribosomal protein S9
MINGKKTSEYITRTDLFEVVYSPLKACKAKDEFYFEVEINGS